MFADNTMAHSDNGTLPPGHKRQHTAAPWGKGRSTGVAKVFNANGEMVCDVLTRIEDANLIVAAPKLLAAARAYLADRAEAGCVADSAAVRSLRAAVAEAAL